MVSCPICNTTSSFFCSRSVKGITWNYYTCNECCLLFLHPKPSKQFLKKHYQEFRYAFEAESKKRLTKQAYMVCKKLLDYNPNGKSLLDIGIGHGHYVDEAIRRKLTPYGIEPSKQLFDKIINKHTKYSKNILNIDISQFVRSNKEKFDYIILSHVIEHLENPQILLKELGTMLNSKGILYIETPNLDSYLFESEREDYTFLTPPDHIYIYSKTALSNSICSETYKVKSFSTYSYPEHITGIIRRKLHTYTSNNNQLEAVRSARSIITNSLATDVKKMFVDKLIANTLLKIPDLFLKGVVLESYLEKT